VAVKGKGVPIPGPLLAYYQERSGSGFDPAPVTPCDESEETHVVPFLSLPAEIRKFIYTTNAIESLHMRLLKILKTRGHFPNDEAAAKLIYLALRNITRKWKRPPVTWKKAMPQFAILFTDRLDG
jgi:transposase-like protein